MGAVEARLPAIRFFPQKWLGAKNQKWLWINTYENTIFRGLFTSINPSYFDVNYRGTRF